MFQEDLGEDYENQVGLEEYTVWKKNAPFLYDLVLSNEDEWPSLTVEWLPKKLNINDADYSKHMLIMGTNTSGQEPNYLKVMKVKLPSEEATRVDGDDNYQSKYGIGLTNGDNKMEVEIQILHQGAVNRARYMPQKMNVIATKTESGEVHVFDYSVHPSTPDDSNVVKPQLRLLGHQCEGYGLSWNERKPGHLISGAYDCKILHWNVEQATESGQSMNPLCEYTAHTAPVEDVCWHRFHPDIFASCDDDKKIIIWDTRQNKRPFATISTHIGEVYTLDFNYFNEFLLLSGSEDKSIQLFDLRRVNSALHHFQQHTDQVIQVQWSPQSTSMFASASADRRVNIWDFMKCGQKLSPEDEQDGPPELVFVHGGHRGKVVDISWNLNQKNTIASIESENNILQIWQPAQHYLE